MQEKPEKLFEKIRLDIRESVGEYFSELMDMGLTQFPRGDGMKVFREK